MATLYDSEGNAFEVADELFDTPPAPPANDGPRTNSDFAALRKQTQATKAAEKVADTARREAAFLRAGIDPDAKEGIASYFVKGYEGDLTADAIRTAAAAAGVIQPPPVTPEQQAQQVQQAADLGAAQRIAGAANAAQGYDQEMAVRQAMDDAYKAGGIEALTAVLQAQGVPRVTL
jgi:hypothetical protein